MKKYIFIIFLILSFFWVFSCFADNGQDISSQYFIKNYDINIDLHEDGSMDVREVLKLDFTQGRHGIIRSIPNQMDIQDDIAQKLNILKKKYDIRILDIKGIGLPLLVVDNSGDTDIRLRNSDDFQKGQKEFLISYKIDGAVNFGKDNDILFWDLVGGKYDTYAEKMSFKINLPKSLEILKKDFIIYSRNSEDFATGIDTKINSGSLVFNISKKISFTDFSGPKIVIKFPKSYFKYDFTKNLHYFVLDNWMIISTVLILILVMIFGIWLSKDKDFDKKPII